MSTAKIQLEIDLLETLSKQGESYSDGKTRFGWRNPIRKDTGTLLKAITISHSPVHSLEIGTAHGLSALYLVDGFHDPDNQTLDTIDFDAAVAESTQQRMDRLQLPVKVHHGDALDVFPNLHKMYDLVFFDAQKNQYLPQLLSLKDLGLIGPGTVILADNVLDRQSECLPFIQWFEDNGVNNHIIATECGLLVARL